MKQKDPETTFQKIQLAESAYFSGALSTAGTGSRNEVEHSQSTEGLPNSMG